LTEVMTGRKEWDRYGK